MIADSTYRRIRAICFTNAGGFCQGKTIGNIYRYVGTGVLGDGANDVNADNTLALGDFGAMVIDAKNNIYISDSNYRRIRVICNAIDAESGFCNGKTAGRHYRIMGTGVAGDGADGVSAATAAMGQAFGLNVDQYGNINLTDLTYPRIRTICASTSGSTFCSDKVAGNVYYHSGTGVNTTSGTDASHKMLAGLGDPRGMATDAGGNFIVIDSRYKYLRLICTESSTSSYCQGKNPAYHYLHTGVGLAGGGLEYTQAINNPMGTMQGIAVDPNGNVFVADNTNFRVRMICYNTTDTGPCFGKTYGSIYYATGIGVTGDGTDGSALVKNIGAVFGLASDSVGNIYLADTTYRRIRVICYNTTFGFCIGKTKGNMYRVAGTGAAGDGVDNAVAASTAMGMPYDLTVDSHGNIFAVDFDYRRVRAICRSTAGYCAGKTIGNSYRAAGSGTSLDGVDNTAALVSNFGSPQSLAMDANSNLFITDATFPRIRAVCLNTSGGFCQGKTAGNMYRVAGTGVAGNGASNSLATTTAIGALAANTFDTVGNLYLADGAYFIIRVICYNTNSGGLCQDKTAGNIYNMFGNGVNAEGESNISASNTAMGNSGIGGLKFSKEGHLLRSDSYNSLRMFFKP